MATPTGLAIAQTVGITASIFVLGTDGYSSSKLPHHIIVKKKKKKRSSTENISKPCEFLQFICRLQHRPLPNLHPRGQTSPRPTIRPAMARNLQPRWRNRTSPRNSQCIGNGVRSLLPYVPFPHPSTTFNPLTSRSPPNNSPV
jgi:hypothetical protein